MTYRDILLERRGAIAIVTFNRPERMNTMSQTLVAETLAALEGFQHDPEVRVVILTGAGDRAFCAGADVADLQQEAAEATAMARRRYVQQVQKLTLAIRQLEKPVLAAVNGVAAGGGCDIALACDIRIASERARFGEVFARIGLFPGTGGTYFLPRLVGIAKALELIWTGDLIDAREAERIGLVSRVVPAEALLPETLRFAERLAQGPPLAISLAKAAVYRGLDLDITSAFDYAATAESITLTSEDHQEGVRAFREKRPPQFRGR
ncbi:MAG: crotonase [Candidatus Tectimicrobiota bacterium]|nr:MAG: crotonase [Candidatus Tectomicrobia bacterium]